MANSNTITVRQQLAKLDNCLKNSDIAAMKFLCRDIISEGKLDNITTGLQMVEYLDFQVTSSGGKDALGRLQNLVCELLYRIGR